MIIDCDTCVVRGPACGDCVVTVLLGAPPVTADVPGEGVVTATAGPVELDTAEQAALAVLAGSGLVPPLRLVPGEGPDAVDGASGGPGRPGEGPAARRAAEAG